MAVAWIGLLADRAKHRAAGIAERPLDAAVGGRDDHRAAVDALDEPAADDVREDRRLGEGGGHGGHGVSVGAVGAVARGVAAGSGTAVSVPERVCENGPVPRGLGTGPLRPLVSGGPVAPRSVAVEPARLGGQAVMR